MRTRPLHDGNPNFAWISRYFFCSTSIRELANGMHYTGFASKTHTKVQLSHEAEAFSVPGEKEC